MQLTREAFERARRFLMHEARELERALFRRAFEAAPVEPVLEALAAYRNSDGGFGRALEPDLRLAASSVLATCYALELLTRVGRVADTELWNDAIDWLVEAHAPDLDAWRSVPRDGERHPHAPWWAWELHEDGTRWPVGVLPRAEVLDYLWRSRDRVPAALVEEQTRRLVEALESAQTLDADSLIRCDRLARSASTPAWARRAVAARTRTLGQAAVCRDPAQWQSYVAKPLKLAPEPESVLAEPLAHDVQRSLDYEIVHQRPDGSWRPYWSWGDHYPDVWTQARSEWSGVLTLDMLLSLRAYDRLEPL